LPEKHIDIQALNQIDTSSITTASIIIAVALLQQAVGIAIEFGLTLFAKSGRAIWPNIYSLFCERFELAAAGKLDESATRIIGNFFLSLNMGVGFVLLFLYFVRFEGLSIAHWIPQVLIVLFAATLIAAVFRMFNAKWVIEECKNKPSNK
jgi:hypothetical protein